MRLYLKYEYRKIQKYAIEILNGTNTSRFKGDYPEPAYVVKKEFDIPVLLTKSVDQIRKIIGNEFDNYSEPFTTDKYSLENWDNCFYSNDYSHDYYINVFFNSTTRRVNYIFISRNTSKENIKDEELLIVGGISINENNYFIDEQFAGKNKDILIGFNIVPED